MQATQIAENPFPKRRLKEGKYGDGVAHLILSSDIQDSCREISKKRKKAQNPSENASKTTGKRSGTRRKIKKKEGIISLKGHEDKDRSHLPALDSTAQDAGILADAKAFAEIVKELREPTKSVEQTAERCGHEFTGNQNQEEAAINMALCEWIIDRMVMLLQGGEGKENLQDEGIFHLLLQLLNHDANDHRQRTSINRINSDASCAWSGNVSDIEKHSFTKDIFDFLRELSNSAETNDATASLAASQKNMTYTRGQQNNNVIKHDPNIQVQLQDYGSGLIFSQKLQKSLLPKIEVTPLSCYWQQWSTGAYTVILSHESFVPNLISFSHQSSFDIAKRIFGLDALQCDQNGSKANVVYLDLSDKETFKVYLSFQQQNGTNCFWLSNLNALFQHESLHVGDVLNFKPKSHKRAILTVLKASTEIAKRIHRLANFDAETEEHKMNEIIENMNSTKNSRKEAMLHDHSRTQTGYVSSTSSELGVHPDYNIFLQSLSKKLKYQQDLIRIFKENYNYRYAEMVLNDAHENQTDIEEKLGNNCITDKNWPNLREISKATEFFLTSGAMKLAEKRQLNFEKLSTEEKINLMKDSMKALRMEFPDAEKRREILWKFYCKMKCGAYSMSKSAINAPNSPNFCSNKVFQDILKEGVFGYKTTATSDALDASKDQGKRAIPTFEQDATAMNKLPGNNAIKSMQFVPHNDSFGKSKNSCSDSLENVAAQKQQVFVGRVINKSEQHLASDNQMHASQPKPTIASKGNCFTKASNEINQSMNSETDLSKNNMPNPFASGKPFDGLVRRDCQSANKLVNLGNKDCLQYGTGIQKNNTKKRKQPAANTKKAEGMATAEKKISSFLATSCKAVLSIKSGLIQTLTEFGEDSDDFASALLNAEACQNFILSTVAKFNSCSQKSEKKQRE